MLFKKFHIFLPTLLKILCFTSYLRLYSEGIFLNFEGAWELILKSRNFARLCRLAGRYDNPIPSRFLAPIDCSKIPALEPLTCSLFQCGRRGPLKVVMGKKLSYLFPSKLCISLTLSLTAG
jgi:hypothetical protein